MLVFGDSRTIASTTLAKPFPEFSLSFTRLIKAVEGAHLLPSYRFHTRLMPLMAHVNSFIFKTKVFDANAHSARAKLSSKSTDNLCHCWNSCRYWRYPLFPNVNELALAPSKL